MEDLIDDRYRRLRPLGSGGGGSVWLADDTLLDRQVAVKTILPLPGEDGEELARGMREARAAAALQHPGAVAVYDVLEHDHAIVMEYVDGRSLDAVVKEDGPLTPQAAAQALLPVAGALAEAHAAGIVHRDIKPSNILVTPDGGGRLADFGIARGAKDVGLTRTGFTAGTAGYFSPELAEGAGPTPESDVWALGVTLYQAVEGRLPHPEQANVLAHLRTIATTEPVPAAQAGALAPLLADMLAWEPAARPGMAEVAARLEDVATGRVAASLERTELLAVPRRRDHGATAASVRGRNGRLVAAGVAGIAGLAALGALVANLAGGTKQPPGAPPAGTSVTAVVTETVTTTTTTGEPATRTGIRSTTPGATATAAPSSTPAPGPAVPPAPAPVRPVTPAPAPAPAPAPVVTPTPTPAPAPPGPAHPAGKGKGKNKGKKP